MKFLSKKLAIAVVAASGLGMAGHAAADVYGLGFLQVDGLTIEETEPGFGEPGLYTFRTNADAILDGNADLSDGSSSCGGTFLGGSTCVSGNPILSGTVQNAPGGDLAAQRAENDYQKFGTGENYSNAEAAIVDAALLLDPATATSQIAESNLTSGTSAQANTNVGSNTFLQWSFDTSGSELTVSFDAIIDVLAQVTGGDTGIATASSSLTVSIADSNSGITVMSWSPEGNGSVTCAVGITCVSTETNNLGAGSAVSLQNVATSGGAANQIAGDGHYELVMNGLTSGDYTIALAATTSTDLIRIPEVPVPGTLFLMGAGLLLGARTLGRKS